MRKAGFAIALACSSLLLAFFFVSNREQGNEQSAKTPVAIEEREDLSQAELLYKGDIQAQQALADAVIQDIEKGISADDFQTGSDRFNGEWVLGSYQMAVLGLGQILLAHPELKETYLPVMEKSIGRMLSPELNEFATEAWGERGLESLNSDNGHAYLGYTNLALSMLRLHKPDNAFSEINDQLTASLSRRLASSPHGAIETYPDEAYPADIAAAIASIALHERATETSSASVEKAINQFYSNFVDQQTHLVFQSVNSETGTPTDSPRASGTALSAYFLSFVDLKVSLLLFNGVEKQKSSIPGLVGIREYPPTASGEGDIDSGELVAGISPSATIFTLGVSRLLREQSLYESLYKTINSLSSTSLAQDKSGDSLIETPLANAMLLAMLTAQPL